MISSEEVRAHLRDHLEVDLVGIAPIGRFPEDGSGRDPRSHYRRARSVVSFGLRVPFASATPYPTVTSVQFGDYTLEAQLNEVAASFSLWLEDRGHIGMPMPAGRDAISFEVLERGPEPKVEMAGSFDLRYAAVVSGIGQIGANGLVINERFGSRIRLCAVLTSADLEGDVPFEYEPETFPDFCLTCGFRCVTACPANALESPGRVDHYKCLVIRNEEADHEVALHQLERTLGGKPLVMAAKQLSYTNAPPHTCSTCTTQCPMDRGRALSLDPFIREGWVSSDFDEAASTFRSDGSPS